MTTREIAELIERRGIGVAHAPRELLDEAEKYAAQYRAGEDIGWSIHQLNRVGSTAAEAEAHVAGQRDEGRAGADASLR